MMGWKRNSVVALILAGSAAAAPADASWSHEASVGVRVYGHEFEQVRVQASGCQLHVRLAFDAPEKGYSDPKNLVRNYYLFRARVKLSGGQTVFSKVFGNSGPGSRTYDFDVDTRADGCWTTKRTTISKLDVIGCRGRVCDLGEFPAT